MFNSCVFCRNHDADGYISWRVYEQFAPTEEPTRDEWGVGGPAGRNGACFGSIGRGGG